MATNFWLSRGGGVEYGAATAYDTHPPLRRELTPTASRRVANEGGCPTMGGASSSRKAAIAEAGPSAAERSCLGSSWRSFLQFEEGGKSLLPPPRVAAPSSRGPGATDPGTAERFYPESARMLGKLLQYINSDTDEGSHYLPDSLCLPQGGAPVRAGSSGARDRNNGIARRQAKLLRRSSERREAPRRPAPRTCGGERAAAGRVRGQAARNRPPAPSSETELDAAKTAQPVGEAETLDCRQKLAVRRLVATAATEGATGAAKKTHHKVLLGLNDTPRPRARASSEQRQSEGSGGRSDEWSVYSSAHRGGGDFSEPAPAERRPVVRIDLGKLQGGGRAGLPATLIAAPMPHLELGPASGSSSTVSGFSAPNGGLSALSGTDGSDSGSESWVAEWCYGAAASYDTRTSSEGEDSVLLGNWGRAGAAAAAAAATVLSSSRSSSRLTPRTAFMVRAGDLLSVLEEHHTLDDPDSRRLVKFIQDWTSFDSEEEDLVMREALLSLMKATLPQPSPLVAEQDWESSTAPSVATERSAGSEEAPPPSEASLSALIMFKDAMRRMFQNNGEGGGERSGARRIGSHKDTDSSSTSASSHRQRYDRHNLRLIRTLGTGSFGRVFLARVKDRKTGKDTDEVVAVKRLTKKALIRQKQIQHVSAEKEILSSINHPFIVNMHSAFKDEAYLYIVMEFVSGGEFFVYLRRQRRLQPEHAKFYTLCIAEMFRYLHANDIVFRDLKPENVLIDAEGYLKLTDFGFAKHIEDGGRTFTLCGTPEYLAPEVLLNKGHSKPVDWWTLGIFVYEMLAGYPPFTDEDVMRIYQKIVAGRLIFPRGFARDARSLVKHLLAHDITCRYGSLKNGSVDVFEHRWLADCDIPGVVARKVPAPYKPQLKDKHSDDSMFLKVAEAPPDEDAPPIVNDEDPFVNW